MANALKKINDRVKQLQKKHPKTKRTTLQKQAGREYRAGKLKVKRKKIGTKKRRVSVSVSGTKRKTGAIRYRKGKGKYKKAKSKFVLFDREGNQVKLRSAVAITGKRKKRYTRYKRAKKIVHCKRVGSTKKKMDPYLVGGLFIGGMFLLAKVLNPTPPAFVPTSNPAVNSSANNILAYASTAGASITAITALINKLNTSSPQAVTSANLQLQSTGALPSDWASVIASGATSAPSMTESQLLGD